MRRGDSYTYCVIDPACPGECECFQCTCHICFSRQDYTDVELSPRPSHDSFTGLALSLNIYLVLTSRSPVKNTSTQFASIDGAKSITLRTRTHRRGQQQ